MQNSEVLTYQRAKGVKKEDSILKKEINMRELIMAIACLLTSRAALLGCMAPLGIAWYCSCAAVDKGGFLIMSLAGALMLGAGIVKAKYIAAFIVFFMVRRYVKTNLWDKPWFSAAAAGAILFICGSTVLIMQGFLYYDMVINTFEALATFGAGLVFIRFSTALQQTGKITGDEEVLGLAVLAGSAVAGLQGIGLFGISLSNILSMYIVLLAALKNGAGMSAAAGVGLGLLNGMAQGNLPALTGVYGFVGLIAGVLKPFGKAGCIIGAIVANATFAIYYNGSTDIMVNVLEIVIAVVLLSFTPDVFLQSIERIMAKDAPVNTKQGYAQKQRIQTAQSLDLLSNALDELVTVTSKVKEGSERYYRLSIMFERVAHRVCDNCGLSVYCWNQNFEQTYKLFNAVVERLGQRGSANAEELPRELSGKCVKLGKLIEASTSMFEIFKAENLCEGKAAEYRTLAVSQLEHIAHAFKSHRSKITEDGTINNQLSAQLSRAFYRAGINVNNILVTKDSQGYEVTLSTNDMDTQAIQELASEFLKCNMTIMTKQLSENYLAVTLTEAERFGVEVAVVSMDKEGMQTVGDAGHSFATSDGWFYCVLSDGMGTGANAAADSSSVVALFESLTRAGFTPDAAIKLTNSSLILNTGKEACTTVDIAGINLHSGLARLYKAGAAATIVKKADSVSIMRWSSFPLGILDISEVEVQSVTLTAGSLLVMLTDGVPDSLGGDRIQGEEQIAETIKAMEDMPSQYVAQAIITKALQGGMPKDDMTVLVAKIYNV